MVAQIHQEVADCGFVEKEKWTADIKSKSKYPVL